jgi:hypothetical protein
MAELTCTGKQNKTANFVERFIKREYLGKLCK